jgi:outer membrane lipoprotein LolB
VIRLATLACAAVLLAGCATAPTQPPGDLPDPAVLTSWTASGRIALALGDEGGSGSFSWVQGGEGATLTIRGPLGAGGMRIESDGRDLRVTQGDGQVLESAPARELLRQRLGHDFPIASLRYWMLGLPAPGLDASVSTRKEAPFVVIEQSGWRVGYEEFESVQGLRLPSRLTASTGGARLKLVVSEWRLPGGAATTGPRQP